MNYDFDTTPERKETYSFKWQKYAGTSILPAWVADTEFRCAQPILDAISERITHGNLGYTLPAQYDPAKKAVVNWLARKHNWAISPDWIVWTPGVVPAFNVTCKAFGGQGGDILIQSPNYPPLLAAPKLNGQQRRDILTVLNDGRYTLDFDQLEQDARRPECKLMILCNPMNPVGSVMSEDEINRVADICDRHDVILCSDEIHCDLILEEGLHHIPAGRVDALTSRSITLMAASKTFNVAGLGTSFAIIPDNRLRVQFTQAAAGIVPWANILGLVATEAAFTHCDDWLSAQLRYLRKNRDTLTNAINGISGLNMTAPQATFLAWIDASGLGVADVQEWAEARGVGPSPGKDFNAPDFFRINFGCSHAMLEDMINRLSSN